MMAAEQILALVITLGLALGAGAAGYGRLQGMLAEARRDIAELKAEDANLHKRISDKGDDLTAVREGQIRLEEGQKTILEQIKELKAGR